MAALQSPRAGSAGVPPAQRKRSGRGLFVRTGPNILGDACSHPRLGKEGPNLGLRRNRLNQALGGDAEDP